MVHSIDVEAGEKRRIDGGVTETHADVGNLGGELIVEGELILTGEQPRTTNPPTGITLPMDITLKDMNMGIALFLVGSLSIVFSLSFILSNWAALIAAALAFVALLVGGIFGMGLEIFWMLLIMTVLLLAVGGVVRWAQA